MQPCVTASCHTIEAESSVSAHDDQTDVERVLSGEIAAFEGLSADGRGHW